MYSSAANSAMLTEDLRAKLGAALQMIQGHKMTVLHNRGRAAAQQQADPLRIHLGRTDNAVGICAQYTVHISGSAAD